VVPGCRVPGAAGFIRVRVRVLPGAAG